MTINDFVYHSPFKIIPHIIVYGITDNDVCHEIHKMYDSEHPKCKAGMSDQVKNATLSSIGAGDRELILYFETDKLLYDYL